MEEAPSNHEDCTLESLSTTANAPLKEKRFQTIYMYHIAHKK